MANSFNVLLFLLLSSHLLYFANANGNAYAYIPDSERLAFDTIFQFGDSLSGTGNLVLENPYGAHSFASFSYGQSIHQPMGRCSDGLLIIDYIANVFHLTLLSPFLDKQANFAHGVNFAVAGSTALNTETLGANNTISPATNSSLSVQLNWFKYHLNSICANPSECEKKIRKSLFVIEIGGNYYNYALLQGKTIEEVRNMVPEVVGTIKKAVEEVIRHGATRVVVRELQVEYPENVAIVYADYYSGLRWILQNAAALGFNEDFVHKACCGSGNNAYNFDLTMMCGTKGVRVCANPARLKGLTCAWLKGYCSKLFRKS